jgi:hypothetical protein
MGRLHSLHRHLRCQNVASRSVSYGYYKLGTVAETEAYGLRLGAER